MPCLCSSLDRSANLIEMSVVSDSVRLPKSAYRYWPTGREAVIAPGKHGRRLIFHRQELTDSEEEQLRMLQAVLDASTLMCSCLPEDWSRFSALRFIYAAKWDVEAAADAVLADLLWRKATLATFYPAWPQLDILNCGGLYVHGRDHKYRPLLIVRPALLTHFPLERVIEAGAYLLEFVLEHMLLPGQVENWVLLLDLADFPGLPRQVSKRISDFFALHYPCRLYNAYILNSTSSHCSSLIANLSPDTSSHFLTETGAVCEKLLDQFNESQIERQYGGAAPTADEFWPPQCPRGRFGVFGHEQTLSDYSSFPEYFPERSLTEDSEGREAGSSVEVLYLSDLLAQIAPCQQDDTCETVTANSPRITLAVRYPAVAVLGPPSGCCESSCSLL